MATTINQYQAGNEGTFSGARSGLLHQGIEEVCRQGVHHHRRVNLIAVLSLVGIAILVSTRTRYPLVRTLLYNPVLLDVARVQHSLSEKGNSAAFDTSLQIAAYLLGAAFFFCSIMKYLLVSVRSLHGCGADELRANWLLPGCR